jgi:glutaredoxin
MKTLLYKDKQFYLCDNIENTKGQTCIVSKYTPSPTNMPHKHFKDKIVIYARQECPHCISFIDFLKKNNNNTQFYDNLIYIEVDSESPKKLFSKKNILQNLNAEIDNHTTVPMVFHKAKFIGGGSDSKTYFTKI